MTSKALEAAYDEAVGMGLMIDSHAEIARIIRAFAQNLSEEAAVKLIEAAARHCKDNPGERVVASWLIGFIAATEKDLS